MGIPRLQEDLAILDYERAQSVHFMSPKAV